MMLQAIASAALWLMVAVVEFLVLLDSKEAASSTSPEPSLSPETPPSAVELESLSTSEA